MTDHTDLLEQSFEINLNNYGPEDVERLNDWAIKAHNALETLQAELDEWRFTNKIDELQRVNEGLRAEVARLAEIERQEPVAEMTLVDMGIGDARQLRVNWLMDGYLDVGAKLYASAGASPVEPSQEWKPALQAEVERLTTLARGQHIELYNARLQLAAAQGQEPIDAVPLDDMVEGSHPSYGRGLFATDNCVKQFYAAPIQQPSTPSDTAITYMTGYSDGREWAGATSQAQPERAPLSDDEIQTIYLRTYNEGFHGRNLEIAFARAIEAAIKQGGQHD